MNRAARSVRQWRELIARTTENLTPAQLDEAAEVAAKWDVEHGHMVAQDTSLPYGAWHAAAFVAGTACRCHRCNPQQSQAS